MAILAPELKEEIFAEGLADPVYFCRVILGEWFPKAMPWFHRGLLALLTRETDFLLRFGREEWKAESGFVWDQSGLDKIIKHFVWRMDPNDPEAPELPLFVQKEGKILLQVSQIQQEIIPRGFSKTTLCNAVVIRAVVYRLKRFIALIAETGPHAAAQLSNVKTQLGENELLIQVYGALAPDRQHPNPWRENEAQALNGIWMIARGRGGQIRGLNRNAKRPDLIIVDDVEDEESVLTPEQRKKTVKWIMSAVRPALPRNDPNAFIQILGTMLHPECMLVTLSKDPTVITVKFGAIDPDKDMLWAAHMSRKGYDSLRESYRSVGALADFSREFDSAISNDEQQIFDTSRIVYQVKGIKQFVGRAIAIDPAISEELSADFCAFAVVGMEDTGLIHVLDFYMKRGMNPREQIDKFFELKVMWECTAAGVESVAYQKALVHLIREEMFRKARQYGDHSYFEVTPITHSRDADKITRVQGVLAPRYSAGYITHQRRFPDLEAQLQDWPYGKVDGPDAVAMAITLLDPYAGTALGSDVLGKKIGEDSWNSDEELIGGDWRVRGI
jgi:hypothetical protein